MIFTFYYEDEAMHCPTTLLYVVEPRLAGISAQPRKQGGGREEEMRSNTKGVSDDNDTDHEQMSLAMASVTPKSCI